MTVFLYICGGILALAAVIAVLNAVIIPSRERAADRRASRRHPR